MPPPRPRPSLRRWLLIGAGAAAGLVAVAWIALVVAFPPERVRAIVQSQLGASLAREVRFESARVGLWPPVRLTVESFALAEPGGFARGAALAVRSIHLDLDVLPLLQRRIVVRRLRLDEPRVHLALEADGGTNLDSLGRPGAERRASPMDFAIDRLDVEGGAILIDDFAARRRILADVESRTRFAVSRAGNVELDGATQLSRLRLGPLSATADSQMTAALAGVAWRLEHRGAFEAATRRLALERLALAFGRAELAFTGLVDLARSGRPRIDVAARGRGLDLGELLGHLAAADARLLEGVRGGGRVEFDVRVRGALAGARLPDLIGHVRVRDGSFRWPNAPDGVDRVAFDLRLAPDSALIPSLTARVAGQPVRGSLEASRLADPLLRFSLAGTLDLASVSRLFAESDARLSGRLAVDVAGGGRARDAGSFALNGTARLENGSVESPRLPRRVENLRGRFAFSRTRAEIQGLAATAGRSSFTIDARAERPLALLADPAGRPGEPPVPPAEVDFQLRSPYLDPTELLAPTPGSPALPNARGPGRVEIARFVQGRLDVANLTARLEVAPQSIEARSFRFDAYGGTVGGSASIGLDDPTRPVVRLDARADSTQADALLGAWTGAGRILHGTLGGTIQLRSDGISAPEVRSTLTGRGLGEVLQGRLGPAPLLHAIAAATRIPAYREVRFDDFVSAFRIENGRVATGPATLRGPHGEWRLAGTTGFDGTLDWGVSITVPPDQVARLGATGALAAGALADERGRLLIDLRVTGPARSPRVALDTGAMRQRLLGKQPLDVLAPVLGKQAPRADTLEVLRRAAEDSARAHARRLRQAVEDSVKKAARDALRRLFGGGRRDTAP